MRAYFTDKNQKSLKKNKLTDDQLKDIKKKDLQAKLAGLNALTDVLNTQRDIVYTDKNFKTLSTEIQHLSERYAERLRQMTQDEGQASQPAESSNTASESQSQQDQTDQSASGQSAETGQSGNVGNGQTDTGTSTGGYGYNNPWNSWYAPNTGSGSSGSVTDNSGAGTTTTPNADNSGAGTGATDQGASTGADDGNQSSSATGNTGIDGQASSGADGTNP